MAFGVPFGGLQEMLRHLFDVARADEPKLLARLRNMQREGFPAGINVGRGVKVAYSVEQLAAVLFLHMLVDAGFPPDFPMQLFNAYRRDILAVAAQAEAALEGGPWPGPATQMIAVHGSVLSHAANPDRGTPPFGHVGALQLIEVQDRLEKLVERPSGVHLLDLAGYLGRGLAHLVGNGFATIEDARSAINSLRSSLD